jgi:hypothetical protein
MNEPIMNHKIEKYKYLILLYFSSISLLYAPENVKSDAKITVEADMPGHTIPFTLFGTFFEDINLASDRRIYPELVHQRSFSK